MLGRPVPSTLTARGHHVRLLTRDRPPPIHFVAATDFGRIVSDSYEDDRATGRTLSVHGPQGFNLPDALESPVTACHPGSSRI